MAAANRLKKAIYALFSKQTWTRLPQSDVLLIASDADRYLNCRGKAYSPLLDTFAELLGEEGLTCASLASPGSRLVGDLACGNPASFDRDAFLSRVAGRLPAAISPKRFSRENLFRRILRHVRCKVVVGIEPAPALCRAGRQEGVMVYEMMHGMGYTSFAETLGKCSPDEWPARFLAYDKVTVEALRQATGSAATVVEMDHPWFARLEREGSGNAAGGALAPELVELQWRFRKTVLLTLQWGYDGDHPDFPGILPNGIVAEEVVSAIKQTSTEVLWLVKLHPAQVRGSLYERHRIFVKDLQRKYPNVFSKVDDVPLSLLLQLCDGHVTMSSMACYEAGWMAVPSLVLCPTTREGGKYAGYFEDLEEAGFVTKRALSASQIAEWARHVSKAAQPFRRIRGGIREAVMEIAALCRNS